VGEARTDVAQAKITQTDALETARKKLQKEPFAEDIDVNRMTAYYGDWGPRGKTRRCWVIDFARRGAAEITPGQWERGYHVVVDADTGGIVEATGYKR
jgi:hypothetical protein